MKLCGKTVSGANKYCASHAQSEPKTFLEYVRLDKGEYLYDPDTTLLYSYNPKAPTVIGKLNADTGTIVVL